MRSFKAVYETALLHKGSESAINTMLPKAKSPSALSRISDAKYLSEMSRRIFRAGLKHEMVDKKWPDFERVFDKFDPRYCAMLSDEAIENLMSDKRIIRHLGKIKAVRANAQFILDVREEHGSFGRFIADWPCDQIVELWILLKKRGTQLGGHSGARFLRMVGKDTFILTDDVVAVLRAEGVVHKAPTSMRDLRSAQDAFNIWHGQSGRNYCEISRIISMATNA